METNAIWLQVFVTVNAATRGSFTEADRSGDPWDVGYQSGKYPWDCSAPYLKKISLGIAFEKIVTPNAQTAQYAQSAKPQNQQDTCFQ